MPNRGSWGQQPRFRREFHDQFVARYGTNGSFAQQQAAVNKPAQTGQSATDGVPPAAPVADTEALRLVNLPQPQAPAAKGRAANKGRS